MRYELKSIGLWALFKVGFFLNLAFGFLIGLLMIPFMMFAMWAESMSPYGELDGAAAGSTGIAFVMMPFIMAIFFAVAYTLLALVSAAIYNLFARWVGGLEFTFEPVGGTSANAPVALTPVTPAVSNQPPPPPPPPATGYAAPQPSTPVSPPPSEPDPNVRPTSHEAGATQQPLFEPQPTFRPPTEPPTTPSDREGETPPQS